MSSIGYAPTLSIPSGGRFPSLGLPNIGAAGREAKELFDRFGGPGGQRFENAARYGTRIGGRVLPVILAVEAGMFAYDLLQQYGPFTLDIRGTGWNISNNCGRPPQWPSTNGAPNCIQTFGIAPFPIPFRDGEPATAGRTLWEVMPLTYNSSGQVLAERAYVIVGTGTIGVRNNYNSVIPLARPDWNEVPWLVLGLNPMTAPILQPRPREEPIPFPVLPHLKPNPDVPSKEQWSATYDVPVSVETFPAVPPQVNVETLPLPPALVDILNPGGGGVAQPGEAVVFPAIPGAIGQVVPEPHKNEPPKKREKELKFRASRGFAKVAMEVFNAFSETEDLVDALYYSIRNKYTGHIVHGRKLYDGEMKPARKVWFKDRNGKWKSRWVYDANVAEKAAYVYRNYDRIDLAAAFENLMMNEIEDRVYGKVGKLHGGAALAASNATGYVQTRTSTLSRSSGIETGSGRLPVREVIGAISDYIDQAAQYLR